MKPTGEAPRELSDLMLRTLLTRRENLADFLREARPAIASRLDFARTHELGREFVTEDWRQREADLLFEIPYHPGEGSTQLLVCLLLEHQSDTDPLIPLRTLLQAVLYWDGQWRNWSGQPRPRPPLRLRPVLPIVLYTGALPWGSNESLRDLCDAPPELLEFVPAWQPFFWSLANRSPEQLLAGGPMLQLLAVMRAIQEEPPRFLDVWSQASTHLAVLADEQTVRWQELIQALLSYGTWKRPLPERGTMIEVVRTTNPKREPEVNVMVETIAEHLLKQGELGLARRILREDLEARFGTLPEALLARITSISDLERLLSARRQIARIEKLDDLQL